MAETMPVAGAVAIVTGAGRGIGLAIAARLRRDGADVMLAELDEGGAAAGLAAMPDGPGRLATFAGNLAEEGHATALVAATLAAFGAVTVLVNNAGGGVIRPFLEHTPETLRTTIDRNLWSAIWCCRAALPPMLARGHGRIVNIGADSVRTGLADHAAYNAAKGGVHGMTTGLAREFARSGVTVNTVAPCATDTPALERYRNEDRAGYDRFLEVIPMGRPAAVDEVAATVAFLVGPDAGFITGQVISINGGSAMP